MHGFCHIRNAGAVLMPSPRSFSSCAAVHHPSPWSTWCRYDDLLDILQPVYSCMGCMVCIAHCVQGIHIRGMPSVWLQVDMLGRCSCVVYDRLQIRSFLNPNNAAPFLVIAQFGHVLAHRTPGDQP